MLEAKQALQLFQQCVLFADQPYLLKALLPS